MKSYYNTTSFNTKQKYPKNKDISQLKFSSIRIINKRILYLVGIPYEIANEETLVKKEYLGQYGSINKIIVNKNGYKKNESNYPTYSCYITYEKEIESSLAILALNNSSIFNYKLNACYGADKYCNYFLKGIKCNNIDCNFLHELADNKDIINKSDFQMKNIFNEQQKIAVEIANIFSLEQKNIYINQGNEMKNKFKEEKIENYFPTIDKIYQKKYIQDLEEEKFKNYQYTNSSYKYYYNSDDKNKNKKNEILNDDNKTISYQNLYSPKNYKSNETFLIEQYENKKVELIDNNEEEDEEYILVRHNSPNKKKYLNDKKNKNYFYKNNFQVKLHKLKYKNNNKVLYSPEKQNLLDKFNNVSNNQLNLVKNINNDINSKTISSNNTNESSNSLKSDINNNKDKENEFFKNYKKSRFSFVNNNSENLDKIEKFIIPEFVEEILKKKLYSIYFNNLICKNIPNCNKNIISEKLLFDEEIKLLKKWVMNN